MGKDTNESPRVTTRKGIYVSKVYQGSPDIRVSTGNPICRDCVEHLRLQMVKYDLANHKNCQFTSKINRRILQLPADFRFNYTLPYPRLTNLKISRIKKYLVVKMTKSCWVNHDQE